MRLAYRAYDGDGRQVADTIEAPNTLHAIEGLRRKGLFVTEIQPDGRQASHPRKTRALWSLRRRLKNRAMLTRQLQVLLASGTPMVEALAALAPQMPDRTWQQMIGDVRSKVEEGIPLSQALSHHPGSFDSIYRSLIAAAESSGTLPIMLERLAKLERKRLHVCNTILGAMLYPCLLFLVALSVLTLLMIFVIPRFGQLFETLDAPLPASTSALIATSEFLRSWWYVLVGALAAAGFGLAYWTRTPAGRRRVDRLLVRLPQIGRLTRSFVTARLARTLGVLLEARVPILEALQMVREGTGNVHYAELVSKARDAVVDGAPMGEVFARSELINPCVQQAIRNGERTGQMGRHLLEIADFMDEDNEVAVRSLMTLIEPLILIALGILVGLVAVSLFTPLFDLTSMT